MSLQAPLCRQFVMNSAHSLMGSYLKAHHFGNGDEHGRQGLEVKWSGRGSINPPHPETPQQSSVLPPGLYSEYSDNLIYPVGISSISYPQCTGHNSGQPAGPRSKKFKHYGGRGDVPMQAPNLMPPTQKRGAPPARVYTRTNIHDQITTQN